MARRYFCNLCVREGFTGTVENGISGSGHQPMSIVCKGFWDDEGLGIFWFKVFLGYVAPRVSKESGFHTRLLEERHTVGVLSALSSE